MKDDAVVSKPTPVARRRKGREISPRLHISPEQQEWLTHALLNDFTAKPDENWPTELSVQARAKNHGYNLSLAWSKRFRQKLKELAPHLFDNVRKSVSLSEKELDEITRRLVASFRADPKAESISVYDIQKRAHDLGYDITRFWSLVARKKIVMMAPELAARMLRNPRPMDQTTTSRSRKGTSELIRARVEPEIGHLFSIFKNATGFRTNQQGGAFELVMKVLAQGILSQQISLTHSLQQARTLRPEDISAVARVLEQIDWSVAEIPRR